ncbi:MAG: aldehyde dehydrogenase (NADP(+)), partial [Planctomycetaceae bacterium]|nr:aldehyde dehydrogenase (NADP(+)) [Planctomycetaceae bacterium]
MTAQHVLIDGKWQPSTGGQTFQANNPATGQPLPEQYPVSPWEEVERALEAAARAFREVRAWPGERFAAFLEACATQIEQRADELVEIASQETALPASPRLKDVELPRTVGQLRKAAAAAREGSWRQPTIDTETGIRAMFGGLGPVAVFGPNNFPFAFNSIAGGDFAAAIAAGNPVIAKGHSSHPGTTRLLAEAVAEAAEMTAMPEGFVQLIYRTSHEDGAKLVGHPLLSATGYTGARSAGLVLKEAADKGGNPIYLELSSINPVFILPGALEERLEALADEFTGSCLMGAGQFCTNPGMIVLQEGELTSNFVNAVISRFEQAPAGVLLGEGVRRSFLAGVETLQSAGAKLLTGGAPEEGEACRVQNTLLKVDGDAFLKDPETLQTEAFGNGSLLVICSDVVQMTAVAEALEGNLTGAVYSDTRGSDDDACTVISESLRQKVGRLLNDKMPTGVAVSPAMNHGGPYPATGHPGFTAVGIPAAIHRFAMLHSYDNIRHHRLPALLQDKNPEGKAWRYIDGAWTQGDV